MYLDTVHLVPFNLSIANPSVTVPASWRDEHRVRLTNWYVSFNAKNFKGHLQKVMEEENKYLTAIVEEQSATIKLLRAHLENVEKQRVQQLHDARQQLQEALEDVEFERRQREEADLFVQQLKRDIDLLRASHQQVKKELAAREASELQIKEQLRALQKSIEAKDQASVAVVKSHADALQKHLVSKGEEIARLHETLHRMRCEPRGAVPLKSALKRSASSSHSHPGLPAAAAISAPPLLVATGCHGTTESLRSQLHSTRLAREDLAREATGDVSRLSL